MKKTALMLIGLLPLLATGAAAQQSDAKGCKDHPLFTRMPGYWIYSCEQKQFDVHAFEVAPGPQGLRGGPHGQRGHGGEQPQALPGPGRSGSPGARPRPRHRRRAPAVIRVRPVRAGGLERCGGRPGQEPPGRARQAIGPLLPRDRARPRSESQIPGALRSHHQPDRRRMARRYGLSVMRRASRTIPKALRSARIPGSFAPARAWNSGVAEPAASEATPARRVRERRGAR